MDEFCSVSMNKTHTGGSVCAEAFTLLDSTELPALTQLALCNIRGGVIIENYIKEFKVS